MQKKARGGNHEKEIHNKSSCGCFICFHGIFDVIGSSYDSCISSSQSSQAEHNLQNIKSGTKRLQAETGQQYAELED